MQDFFDFKNKRIVQRINTRETYSPQTGFNGIGSRGKGYFVLLEVCALQYNVGSARYRCVPRAIGF